MWCFGDNKDVVSNCLLRYQHYLDVSSPDIQRDRHHGVENDDVGPEGEEGRKEEVVYRRVPGQIALK